MLQPRRRKLLELAWLLLAGFCLRVACDLGNEDAGSGNVRAELVGRDDNEDNTVLLLDNNGRNGRYLATAVPVVTSTARTFVQEGTTTEYATHVIGTRLDKGKLYASVVGTSSRVYYDTHLPRYSIDNQILPSNARPPVRPAAHLVYPDKEARIHLSNRNSASTYQTYVNSDTTPTKVLKSYPDITAIKQSPLEEDLKKQQQDSMVTFSSQSSSSKHIERKQKDIDTEEDNYLISPNQEMFKKRNADKPGVNPAQVVKPVLGLPTFTIKHDFAPSGFSADTEEEEDTTEGKTLKERVFQRGGKALYRNGIKMGNRKLDTVTYRGFADFTTTVGDTVIIFMPNTASTEASKVVIQPSSSTLTEDPIKIVTKMKTFYSHTPGMQTKTVTGHSISMQTSLPTHVVLPDSNTRQVKAFSPAEPVLIIEGESSTEPIEVLTKETPTEQDDQTEPEVVIEPSSVSLDSSMPADSEQFPSVVDSSTVFLPSPTEPLATFATTRTQILAAADQEKPLGLIKVLGGTRSHNSTTTLFTSLIYGTVIDGTYSQVIHSTSSVYVSASTAAVNTTAAVPATTAEPEDISTTTENVMSTNNEDIATNPMDSTTPALDTETVSNEVETGRKIKTRPQDQFIVDSSVDADKDVLKENPVSVQQVAIATDENLTKLIPTTVFKTFTYLTTFFIPDGSTTTTSVRSREVTTSDVNIITSVISGNVDKMSISSSTVSLLPDVSIDTMVTAEEKQQTTTNAPIEKEVLTTISLNDKASTESTTLDGDKTTEFVTEVEKTTTEKVIDEEGTTISTTVKEEQPAVVQLEERTVPTPTTNSPVDNEDEEIDLIFKTLYTTYTYLTTFFQESTTSVSSREVVVTNIVTSTLDRDFLLGATDAAVASLFGNGESTSTPDIQPTSVGVGRPTTQPFSGFIRGSDEDSDSSPGDILEPSETDGLDGATKTFFTTYTYFTTIFVDGETTISSRTEVYTNVVNPSLAISSTPTFQNIRPTRPAVDDDLDQEEAPQSQIQVSGIFENLAASHTRISSLKSTPHYAYSSTISRSRIPSSGSISLDIRSSIASDEIDANESNDIILPQSNKKIKDSYATLTRSQINDASAAAFEGTTFKSHNENEEPNVTEESVTSDEPNMRMKEAILAQEQGGSSVNSLSGEIEKQESSTTESSVTDKVPEMQVRVDTFFAGEDLSEEPVTMKILSMVTDMTSSTSGGNALPNALDDQVSSESNTEEIEPSPTLLLQTSFTTFTYFTTVYKGSTSSEVISRLETITNVVTETLSPTRSSVIEEDSTLPITYFTTFTYWTTLYRDGNTVITSREETVSNVITPTVTLPTVLITATQATELEKPNADPAVVEPASVQDSKMEPTTYYTTYTYFTTSYVGNNTVLNSRLETVTNVVNETEDQSGRAIGASAPDQLIVDQITKTEAATLKTGLLSTIFTSEVSDGTTTLFSTDVYGTYIDGLYAQILESSTQIVTDTISKSSTVHLQPTGVVSLNEGRIVDADGISTTYFTTMAIGTYIEQLYAQVIESTSSVKVDEEKKTQLALENEGDQSQKTGLVRLIEGTQVKDHTTTFYESKVVGTVIDGRYAQIIESTSSYKIDKTTEVPKVMITATPAVTLGQDITGTNIITTSPNPTVIESSLGEDGTEEEQEGEEEDEDEEDDGDGSLKKSKKSRLTFSSRKRTFTPVIRPFASRNRPTFNPRRKTAAASSATTITRTTLTPTVTATPAAKSSESRGRFATSRRQSSALNEIRPTASSSRRFSRVRGSTPGLGSSSISSLSPSRGRSSSRVFPTATVSLSGSSRRAGFYRSSSTRGGSSDSPPRSSIGASNSRFRIRPTSSGFARGSSSLSSTPINNDQTSLEENDITTLMTEETPAFTEEEQDSPTQALSTTTESPRRSNPLLRFRRPPNLRAPTTSAAPTSTAAPRRNSLLRRTSDVNSNKIVTTSTTVKPPPSFNSRFKNLNNNRPRPSNSLFPRRELLKKPEEEVKVEQKILEKDEDVLQKEDSEEDIGDNDYEGSEVEESNTEASPRRGKAFTPQIRPFVGFQRRRSKRQTSEYGARRDTTSRTSYNQRFRRPTTRAQSSVQERVDVIEEEIITEAPKSRSSGRFTPRPRPSQQVQPKIRSTTASSNTGRSQFTLREKDTTPRTAFRRPTPSPRRRPTSNVKDTTNSRQQSRLRPQLNSQTDAPQYSRSNGRRYSNTNANSRRPVSRSRSRGDTTSFESYTPAAFDGTITVTHRIPTEVTIPVVNGKITEYRNVITASPSTEILGPHQYTATSGKDGSTVLLLTSEVTGTLAGGVTEITQYVLHGTPTTSVTFTPTTIRGRKTSYSHIVPSTAYEVERLVSTIHPHLSPNAPLANILLSQLLLGNLNLAQPNINPLLGLNQAQTAPATPITEFKTRATTYVTTVTKGTSTILPLTFRGKEILTTIVEMSLETITATEFITDTIVITPTAAAAAANQQQLNSLLLPALLQAQLLQSQGQQTTQNPLFSLQQNQEQKIEDVIDVEELARGSAGKRRKQDDPDRQVRDSDREYDDDELTVLEEEPKVVPRFKPSRKKPARGQVVDKKPPDPPLPATSVITLYVSGRRPGEFSTVLSTIVVDDDSSTMIKKREAAFAAPDLFKVNPSELPTPDSYLPRDQGYLENTLLFSVNDVPVEISRMETQSLESIVGDVTKYNNADQFSPTAKSNPTPSKKALTQKSSIKTDKITGHFLSKGPAEFTPLKRKVVIKVNGGGVEEEIIKQKKLKTHDTNSEVVSILQDTNTNTNKHVRVKRNTEDSDNDDDSIATKPVQTRYKRIRVRVPTARRISDGANHESYSFSKARHPDQDPDIELDRSSANPFIDYQQNHYSTRTKVVDDDNKSQNVNNNDDSHKKRILIRRRKPTHENNTEPRVSTNTLINNGASVSSVEGPNSITTRRKVVVTKRRTVTSSSSLTPTASSHRRRVVVTKKRLLATLPEDDVLPESTAVLLDPPDTTVVTQILNSLDYSEHNSPNISNFSEEESVKDKDIPLQTELNSLSNSSLQIQSSFVENSFANSADLSLSTTELPSDIVTTSAINGIEIDPSTTVQMDAVEGNTTDNITGTVETLHATSMLEESSTLDGPRFIRPTRFSITRKPSRSKASFHGGRRKTSEFKTPTNSPTKTGFRSSTDINTRSSLTTPADLKPSPTANSFKPSSKAYRPNKSKTYGKANTTPLSDLKDSDETLDSPISESKTLHSEITETPQTGPISDSIDVNRKPASLPTPVKESEVNLLVARLVTRTKLRTYTYIVTRVAGSEVVVTSSTEVKPHVTTETITQSLSIPDIQETARDGRLLNLAEARYNLATKVMSNGVEVIVAGDKSTLPGGQEILRVLSASPSRPTTLAASTLTDHMMMYLPNKDNLSPPLDDHKFVTNTYLTTYRYLQTSVDGDATDVSQEEHVVTNIATEDQMMSTPALEKTVTLTTSPDLATGVFHTTYTFFNTLKDGDVNLVHTSTHTLENTITGPVEELIQTSRKETNIYLSTIDFSKTVTESGSPQLLSTQNVLTQKVVTQVAPQTNEIELLSVKGSTTDVVKTYFVTYTYLNTYLEDGSTVVSSDVSISTDIVTEKFYLNSKRTSTISPISNTKYMTEKESTEPVRLYATKTYLTTFTYFTTLLQEGSDHKTSTLVSSHTSVVQNVVTESVSHSGSSIKSSLKGSMKPKKTAIQELKPTQTNLQSDEMTTAPGLLPSMEDVDDNQNVNNVVTGSTIIFFDENDQIDTHESPSATNVLDVANNPLQTTIQTSPSQGVINPQALTSQNPLQVEGFQTSVLADSTVTSAGTTLMPGDEVIMVTQSNGNITMIPVSDPSNKKPHGGSFGPGGSEIQVSDLLSLGSLGINGINALGPVINAMAGLIKSNNKHGSIRRNDSVSNSNPGFTYLDVNDYKVPLFHPLGEQTSPRSPIYIPVGKFSEDVETAESVNQELWSDANARHPSHGGNAIVLERPSLDSPLLSDGIAISPGQVITANSDVIIGKPGILGPRPPKIHSEKEIPAGMRPPPLPRPNTSDKEQYFGPPPSLDQVGHHSINHHVGAQPSKGEHQLSHGPLRIQAGQDQAGRDHPVRNYIGRPVPPKRDYQQGHSPPRDQQQNRLPVRDHQHDQSPLRDQQDVHSLTHDQHDNHSPIREQPHHYHSNGKQNHPLIRDQLQNHPIIRDQLQNHPIIRDQSQNHPIIRDHLPNHPIIRDQSQNHPTIRDQSQNHPVIRDQLQNHPTIRDQLQNHQIIRDQSQNHQIIRDQSQNHPLIRDHSQNHPMIRDLQQTQHPIRNHFQGHILMRDQNIDSDLNPPPITDNFGSFHLQPELPLQTPSIGADIIVHPPILNENHYEHVTNNNPNFQEFGQFPVSSGVQAVLDGQPHANDIIRGKMPTGSHILDSSAGRPLLVDIQPSQVANVIIKDGSSTANPFEGNTEFIDRSPEGADNVHHFVGPVGSVHETRMDPAPAIDIGVGGIVGVHQEGINVDITPGQGINVDVSPGHRVNIPLSDHVHGNEHIAPSGIVLDELVNERPSTKEVGFGRPHDSRISQGHINGPSRPRFPVGSHRPGNDANFEQNHMSNQISHVQNQELNHVSYGQNYPKTPIEFMVPPPPPTQTQFNNQPLLIPLNGGVSPENSKEDHFVTDENDDEEDSLELEGGELVQASNYRPLRPGQVPAEIEKASKKRPPIRQPVGSETPEVFMRPPDLPVSNINIHQVFDKRPSNKPTSSDVNTQPQGQFERPQIYKDDQLPNANRPNLTKFDERLELTSQGNAQGVLVPELNQQGRPHFEVGQQKPSSTNGKRPYVSFGKQTVQTSFDQATQSSTRRPFLTRVKPNEGEIDREPVVGLSPPPEPQKIANNAGQIPTTPRRPVPNYRNKTRPVAPYKFEVPTRLPGHPHKSGSQEVLTLSESVFQQKPGHEVNADKAHGKPGDELIKAVTIRPPQLYRPKTVRPVLPHKQSSIKNLKTNIANPSTIPPALQTVVVVGKPIQSNSPLHPGSPKQPEILPQWNGHILGSETVFGDHITKPTPVVRKPSPPSKVPASSSKPSYVNVRPSSVLLSTGFATVTQTKVDVYRKPSKQAPEISTSFITHTKTLFVTLTETTIVSSEGQRPSTRTLIVTKTQTSTLVDTVTQIHTLLQPTEIRATATVTTTVSQYPPGSPFDPANYPQFPVKMMTPNVKTGGSSNKTVQVSPKTEKKENEVKKAPEENETFFVVVNDKKHSSVNVNLLNKDKTSLMFNLAEEEIASRDETEPNNEVNRAVLLGGVLVAAPPPRHGAASSSSTPTACRPDCSPARNELCQRVNGQMRCVCRPGFARMFPDRPCKPTYTYTLRLDLERHGKEPLKYETALKNTSSPKFRALAEASREGLDRLVMQSDLRDIYHGVAINGFQPASKKDAVVVNFYVQLSENANETRLKDVFKKSLRTSNFSLGGTDVFADRELLQHLQAEDFDECVGVQFHDCSEHSHCFNMRGTYTCSCKEGFADLSENSLFPGRVCSAELIGCEKCHYHGTCYSRGDEQQQMCECFQWYSGENCQVNLKVLLIALVTIGAMLLALLLVCAVLTCLKRANHHKPGHNAPGFLRYRAPPRTMDKRAMIADSSSEGSVDNGPVTFLAPTHQSDSSLGKPIPKGARKMTEIHPSGTIISVGYGDQRDRSLTVMIPRAKYRPVPPTSPHLTMSTFGVEENKRAIIQEQKLIGYLEHGVQLSQENRTMNGRRKQSNVTSHSDELIPTKKMSLPRKPSTGALVSAGFEVSATVGHKQEAIIDVITPHNTMGSQFPIMRANERTVSEARSCDETTVQPPTKSFHGQSHYGSKPSSRNRDEAHTMAERDLGSTLLMPQTHLYRPDRGSDISNFDSL